MNKQPKQILKPNKAGRPAGSLNKRTLIRNALAEHYPDGEQGFWLAVAQMAAGGDVPAMQMLADRLSPKLKPQAPEIELPTPLTGDLADMARQLIEHAGNGALSTSQASDLLNAMANAAKVIEVNELQQRLDALEKLLQPKETKNEHHQ